MLLPFLALGLLLSVMTDSIEAFHALLANEFLSGLFAAGVVDKLEGVEGGLEASLGRNLPVADCDFMIVILVVFGDSSAVAGQNEPSQRANSFKESGPFHIHRYSVALAVAGPNFSTSFKRAEFDGPDVAIECFELVFGKFTFTTPVKSAQQCKRVAIIFQASCLKSLIVLHEGRYWFAAEWTSKGNLFAGILLVLLIYGLLIFHEARIANESTTARLISRLFD